jgi:transposase-like protein
MDPHKRFCHNERCWAYARRAGEGHIVIHSKKEQRYRCKRCAKTFSATKGTALYRMHKPHALLATVVTLLWHTAARLRPSLRLSLWTNAPSIAGS